MSEKTTQIRKGRVESTIEFPPRGGSDSGEPVGSENRPACEVVAEDLTIGYPGLTEPVIDGESLHIRGGSVTALIGPNGSGKSTLLKGLAAQVAKSSGSVYLDGREISAFDTKALAKKLGLLSQENVAPDSLTVEKLVGHGRYPHRGFFDSLDEEDRRAIERAISLAGIEHLRDREIGNLSGGQKQLVWIAMVLAQETDALLLDEPTTFLDLHHKLEVMDVIDTLRDESAITIVVVLHDIERAARIADHVVALKDGSIRATGPPEDVITEGLLASVFGIESMVARTHHGLQITPVKALSTWGTEDRS